MTSNKTIRIYNISGTNLSMHLSQIRAPAHGSLKRGGLLTPILISQGGFYDVCAQLGVDYAAAERIIAQSPEIRAFEHCNRIRVLDFPPAAVEPAPSEVVPAPSAPVPVGEVPSTPEEKTPVKSGLVELPPQASETAEAATAAAGTGGAAVSDAVPVRTPSMDWSEDQLRAYAEKHDIDISKAKSKTAVLKTIRIGK